MGNKGDQLTNASSKSAQKLQEDLSTLADISIRKMFGGYGVFEGKTMFSLVDSDGVVFFKVDDTNIKLFETAGSAKHGRMPYYQVPDSVLADQKELHKWAKSSITVAKNAKK